MYVPMTLGGKDEKNTKTAFNGNGNCLPVRIFAV